MTHVFVLGVVTVLTMFMRYEVYDIDLVSLYCRIISKTIFFFKQKTAYNI